MPGELISFAAEKALEVGIETIKEASEIAELGAIKPKEYGTLVRSRELPNAIQERIEKINSIENLRPGEFSTQFWETFQSKKLESNNLWLSLRPQEIAKDVAEYLCDNDITPNRWMSATIAERAKMLEKATHIISKELKLPESWQESIKPEVKFIPPEGDGITRAYASYSASFLHNGGVRINGIPELVVNELTLRGDYFQMMSTLYHEMIHIKQFASVDGINPAKEKDIRLLDLIEDMRKAPNGNSSRVEYLSSPFEAEAWAQGLYFKEMLKAVVLEM